MPIIQHPILNNIYPSTQKMIFEPNGGLDK